MHHGVTIPIHADGRPAVTAGPTARAFRNRSSSLGGIAARAGLNLAHRRYDRQASVASMHG